MSNAIDPDLIAIVEQQIGRVPRGLCRIFLRANGQPQVVQTDSLVGETPFPTLYWLTYPPLIQFINRLEGEGWVKKFEQQIQEDAELRAAHHRSQHAYIQLRWDAMSETVRQQIQLKGLEKKFKTHGIGGIADLDRVRCLHMQYAHHLVGDNAIGSLMDQLFQLDQID